MCQCIVIAFPVLCVVQLYSVVFSFLATKVDQARRFNDPNDNCKVLIASDAVGMGLNL